jgi:hypothetical protein
VDKFTKLIGILTNPAAMGEFILRNTFTKTPGFIGQLIDAGNSLNARDFF